MSAYLALDLASRLGVKLGICDGRIVATPKGAATQELRELAKEYKPELITLLSKVVGLPPEKKTSALSIPLPTASPAVRETAKGALRVRGVAFPGVLGSPPYTREGNASYPTGEITPDLKRVVELTQEVFSQTPKPPKASKDDGLSPSARQALSAIRKLTGSARILDALAVADSMKVSVTALSGSLVELECKRLIQPGDWTRCGSKIKLVTH